MIYSIMNIHDKLHKYYKMLMQFTHQLVSDS